MLLKKGNIIPAESRSVCVIKLSTLHQQRAGLKGAQSHEWCGEPPGQPVCLDVSQTYWAKRLLRTSMWDGEEKQDDLQGQGRTAALEGCKGTVEQKQQMIKIQLLMTQERVACLLTLFYVKPHPGQLSAARKGQDMPLCLSKSCFVSCQLWYFLGIGEVLMEAVSFQRHSKLSVCMCPQITSAFPKWRKLLLEKSPMWGGHGHKTYSLCFAWLSVQKSEVIWALGCFWSPLELKAWNKKGCDIWGIRACWDSFACLYTAKEAKTVWALFMLHFENDSWASY